MAQSFRSALNGFNREDVVHYLEYLNNKHSGEITTLNAQLEDLRRELAAPAEELAALKCQVEALTQEGESLRGQLDAARAEKEQLQKELDALRAEQGERRPQPRTGEELEAYRRAERTERLARERAEAIYAKTNTILTDATGRVDAAAQDVSKATEEVRAYLDTLETALGATRQALQDAAASMYNLNL